MKGPDIFKIEPVSEVEVRALRAVRDGTANPDQQKLTIALIVNKLARTHDLLYVPDSFDQSAFLNGRAFVGQQILKHLNVPISKLIPTIPKE